MAKDYYRTLGVDKTADNKEIKKAFRRLAKQYHPDANPNPAAEAKFKEINEAYETLSNPEKRKLYDQFGADYANFQNMGGAGAKGQAGGVRFDESQFQDIFESIFGGFGRSGNRQSTGGAFQKVRGQDVTQDVTISLRDAYEGAMLYVEIDGKRSKVKIPQGATNGTKVRVAGKGEPGRMGGEAGDLYLVVNVTPDPQFERDGDNLIVEVQCDMFTALLGGEIEVPTLARPVRVKVPAGAQSGQKLRVAGKGMPKLREKGKYGDLFARLLITVPKGLSESQKQLVEQLKASLQ